MGVFADHAPGLIKAGKRPIPVRPDKRPCVQAWQKATDTRVEQWIADFPDANIALFCGAASGVTVVDVDIPGELALLEAIRRFGDSPLISRTPSGGHHLFYRYSGERRQIKLEGLAIDILGAGYCLLPPSVSLRGNYQWVRGDSAVFLDELPRLRAESLESELHRNSSRIDGKKETSRRISMGERNRSLFDQLRHLAKITDSLKELEAKGLLLNTGFDPPLATKEVLIVARSVWRYKCEGRLLTKAAEATALITKTEAFDLSARALKLLSQLRCMHGVRQGEAIVMPYQAAKVYGLSLPTMRKALDELAKSGKIEMLVRGVKGQRAMTQIRLLK